MLVSTLLTVLAAGLATAAPVQRRAVTLDKEATAEAQKKDNTATRAFTATSIKTSDGKCLSVDPLSGDFRQNLTPVTAAACDGSPNQQWDVITAGVHNNVKGQALVVSSLTNACLNFDPRRAAGNQVLLFSCGGRADGDGKVTDSQLFAFTGGAGPQALVPQNGKNAVCLTIKGNALDQTACKGANSATGAELFTFGGKAAANNGAAATTKAAIATTSSAADCVASTVTKTVTVTAGAGKTNVALDTTSSTAAATTTGKAAATTTGTPTLVKVSGARGVLDPTAVAESQKKDTTATRAATGVEIKTSDGKCLSVDATAGDFRQNLIPVAIKDCDKSDGQKFDFITKGIHNDKDGQTLIVSSLTNGCINFDDRRAEGDKVNLFSCGGRADGDGKVTDGQLFPFEAADLKKPYALAPKDGKNTICLINNNGRLSNAKCDASKPAANQLFTIGSGATNGDATGATSVPAATSSSTETATKAATTTEKAASTTTGTPTVVKVSGARGVLDPTAVAESHKKDTTATRAATGAQIKTSDGKCLSVDATAGDFRQNLIPVAIKDCDNSDGQKFDFITKGIHNDKDGQTLIVSSLTNGCINFDDRRAEGDKVNLFSCGGRADGDGKVTDGQLFPFEAADLKKPYALAPKDGKNTICLINNNGRLSNANCDASKPAANQLFTIVA
ncbi:hypothetical protein B0H15DRAFT_885494 [Mycena belliarum]|uniref:Ricin B lectin domain-containing protein n=1 Tax=Mycena belliarum TaxID=1033014 RepID=A0AAD6U3M1_9AGAR|nr:hypothetical protein B0H15DRAFT_885494 [Mycena belliae]